MVSVDLLELAPRLYRLRVPGGNAHLLNCYLWLGEDGVTLVDTGWPETAGLIADALTALGRRPGDVKRIVLTHFHDDHAGAAAEIADWSDLEVIAGAADTYVTGETRGPLPNLTAPERAIHPGFEQRAGFGHGEAVLTNASERIAAATDVFADVSS